MNRPIRLLFKYPCRGRKELLFKSLDSLNDNIRDRNNYHIGLTLDTDDEILNTPEVIDRINTYQNVSIQWGLSDSKINAVNRHVSDYDWDLIIVWSNDMVATFYGFDDVMRTDSLQQLEIHNYDMLLHFPEPDSVDVLNVLYIATKKYYDRFGYVYHPSYKSLWCDNESMCVAKMLGRYHFFGTQGLYVHANPAYAHSLGNRDMLFDEQQGYWQQDEDNFHRRRKLNFELKDEEIVSTDSLAQYFPFT